jgi:hypothetical protein
MLSGAYPFPPPKMFLNENRGLQYLAAWTFYRPTWTGALAMGAAEDIAETSTTPPRSRVWAAEMRAVAMKTWPASFATAENPSTSTHTSEPQRKKRKVNEKAFNYYAKRKEQDAEQADERFAFLRVPGAIPADFSIDRVPILRGGAIVITPVIARMLLWDLCQCNAHIEFLILERVICPDLGGNPARIRLVNSVFSRSLQIPSLPATEYQADMGGPLLHEATVESDGGEVMYIRADRLKRFKNFREVLKSWPNANKFKFILQDVDWEDAEQFKEVQLECYTLYCQTFFDTFGRAPTLPRYLPDGWQ